MPETMDLSASVERLSPAGKHFFFGYYDLPAADAQGRHLGLEVPFRDRFPSPENAAVLGWLPLPSSPFAAEREDAFVADSEALWHPFSETFAWNFQQSCMLQWLPTPHECLYNIFDESGFGSVIHNVASGERRRLPLPVANVSTDGTKALCVNMARIYDFRPGYGYEEMPDPFAQVAAPHDDGVFLMDLATGAHRFILSLEQAVEFLAAKGEEDIIGQKVVINHITFNPSARRFLFLLRNFPESGSRWQTWLLTANGEGEEMRAHRCYGMASHYHWRDDSTILIYMNISPTQAHLVLLNDETGEAEPLDPQFFTFDGHCSFSPDRQWLLYDSYARLEEKTGEYFRTLYVYSLKQREGIVLGRFRSEALPWERIDLRCDLHPRWMPDGKSISFDSIHEGFRGIYWMDLSHIMG